jgi:hypothetical protein
VQKLLPALKASMFFCTTSSPFSAKNSFKASKYNSSSKLRKGEAAREKPYWHCAMNLFLWQSYRQRAKHDEAVSLFLPVQCSGQDSWE